jgi:acyl-CoA-binding protein
MSQETYRNLIESFAALKGISKDQAAEIIIKVVKDYQKGLKK